MTAMALTCYLLSVKSCFLGVHRFGRSDTAKQMPSVRHRNHCRRSPEGPISGNMDVELPSAINANPDVERHHSGMNSQAMAM